MADLSIQLTKLKTFIHMPSGKTFVEGKTYTLPKKEAEEFLGMNDDGIPRFRLALKKAATPATAEEAPVRRRPRSRISEEARERIRRERSMASSKRIEPPEDADTGSDTGPEEPAE